MHIISPNLRIGGRNTTLVVHLQDVDDQKMGLTSNPSYYALKQKIKELNGDIPY